MPQLIYCFAFILASTVLAQAAPLDELDFGVQAPFETTGWVAKYAGETELDGLPVIASFDTKESSFAVPQWYAEKGGMHLGLPATEQPKPLFRLTLTAAHNAKVRAIYSLQRRMVSLDGMITLAYVSDAADERGFCFLVVIGYDGEIKVSYTRKTALNSLSEGRFSMSPVPQTL